MKRLIQWSIDHHWMVLGLAVLLAAAGAWTARTMPVDVFPDLNRPTVTVMTGRPVFSATQGTRKDVSRPPE